MAKRIVIICDLLDSPDRKDFLNRCAAAYPDIEWEWVKCCTPAFNVPKRPFNRLLAQLRDPQNNLEISVVKLFRLNGREANRLYQTCPDPILAPNEHQSSDSFFGWLTSDDAALVKEPPWMESVRVAALLAILAKLIRNKSWNGTKAGHAWTQEADLLGQAPVYVEGGVLYAEARQLLNKMENVVLLCKGGKQGKTKTEWCICLDHLPVVKRSISTRLVQPLRETPPWDVIVAYADEGPQELVLVDEIIVNETVRYNCREQR